MKYENRKKWLAINTEETMNDYKETTKWIGDKKEQIEKGCRYNNTTTLHK